MSKLSLSCIPCLVTLSLSNYKELARHHIPRAHGALDVVMIPAVMNEHTCWADQVMRNIN
jgi:hypothetical protein